MDDMLKYAVDHGMIDLSHIQHEVNAMKRKDLLKKHPYKIWRGNDDLWRTYLPDNKKGRVLRKRRSLEELEDLICIYWEEKVNFVSIEEVFEECNNRRLQLGKISKATHFRNVQTYNRHFKNFGKKNIKRLEPGEISDFLEEQIYEFNLTSKAFSNLKTLTKQILKRAKKRRLISFNVDEIFQELDVSDTEFKKSVKKDSDEVFGEQELPELIGYLVNNQDITNLGILLIFVTGLRVGELVALRWSDVQNNSIRITKTETKYRDENGKFVRTIKESPKTEAGIRTVVIPSNYVWIIKAIKRINPFGEYMFMKDDKRIHTETVRRRLYRVCDKLGIEKKSPHKGRKTYASILLDNHIDRQFIINQMGHTDIACTENYYHRNRRTLLSKTKILDDIPEFQAK